MQLVTNSQVTYPAHIHAFREAIVAHGSTFAVVAQCEHCPHTILRSVTPQDALRLPIVGLADEPVDEPAPVAA
jgi:hypothetical protein